MEGLGPCCILLAPQRAVLGRNERLCWPTKVGRGICSLATGHGDPIWELRRHLVQLAMGNTGRTMCLASESIVVNVKFFSSASSVALTEAKLRRQKSLKLPSKSVTTSTVGASCIWENCSWKAPRKAILASLSGSGRRDRLQRLIPGQRSAWWSVNRHLGQGGGIACFRSLDMCGVLNHSRHPFGAAGHEMRPPLVSISMHSVTKMLHACGNTTTRWTVS